MRFLISLARQLRAGAWATRELRGPDRQVVEAARLAQARRAADRGLVR